MCSSDENKFRLKFLPLFTVDSGLPEDACEKFFADVVLVWIGNAEGEISPAHKLMFPAGVWAVEPELTQVAD